MLLVTYQDPYEPNKHHSLLNLTAFDDNWVGLAGIPYFIYGGDGNDILRASSGNDVLAGGAGNDAIAGGWGDDRLFGGTGNDLLIGGNGFDIIYGDDGNDVLYSGNQASLFGPNVVVGSDFWDAGAYMRGGNGNDSFRVDHFMSGRVVAHGGSGYDTLDLRYSVTEAMRAEALGGNLVDMEGMGRTFGQGELQVVQVEAVFGSVERDWIHGDNAENDLRGFANDDVLEGRGGADRLDGGAQHVYEYGDNGLYGDTASYESASSRVYVDLTLDVQKKIAIIDGQGFYNGDAAEDRLISIEDLLGSNHDDFLRGNSGRNVLDGGKGNDILEGRGGGDLLRGGDGHDIASYVSSASKVTVALENGTPRFGDAEGDVLERIEGIHGSHFNDMIYGSSGTNTLHGNNGDDYLYGWGGTDTIRGGIGNDKIYGGTGRDVLWGDAGADAFRFASVDSTSSQIDVIMEFQKDYLQNGAFIEGDTIDFSSIDTNPNALGNQNFTSVYVLSPVGIAASFTEDTVRLRVQHDAAGRMYTKVEAEWTGDGQADLVLHVYTATNQALSASDFIL